MFLLSTVLSASLAGVWKAQHDYTPRDTQAPALIEEGQTWVASPAGAALRDVQHLYLYVNADSTGTLHAFIRNPESNAGAFVGARVVSVSGSAVRLERAGKPDIVGTWSPGSGKLTLRDPGLSGTFVFTRYAAPVARPYVYRRPANDGDGWETGTLQSAGLDELRIAQLMERIRRTAPALSAPYIQSVSIARHGKLVLDEYFNDFDAERPHDVRSAGKSVTTLIAGRAMNETGLFSPSTPVASILSNYGPIGNGDQRKEKITVGDLMSMSAGYACDDNDDNSPGNEDTMQSQTTQPDWYKFTLGLPMQFDPGTHAFYCSAEINLLGAVVERATHEWLPQYFYEKFAAPMQFGAYGMWLMPPPVNTAYMAGGDRFRPRDFLKFGQLFLNGGRWNGRQIVSADWLRACATKHSYVVDGGGDYGYGWHLLTYTVHGRTIHAINAGGNGGQLLYVFPELDMAVMITAANYGQYGVWKTFGEDLVPNEILTAVIH